MVAAVSDALWGSLLAFIFYILVMLFELLVLPLVSAFVIYKFLQFALGRVLKERPRGESVVGRGPEVSLEGG